MKSLFKFSLLAAIIISGKIAKQQTAQPAVAQRTHVTAAPKMPVVLAHETTTAAPVKNPRQQSQNQTQPTNSGIIIEMY